MRSAVLSIVLLLAIKAGAQTLPEWYRVHTFDDSFIEMNTALLTAIDKDITRVRFRWTFDQAQTTGSFSYKSKLEVIELNCSQDRARTYHITLMDAAGQIVHIDDTAGEWRAIAAGSMLQKLAVPACDLVTKKSADKEVERKETELMKVAAFAYEIGRRLSETRDFKSIDQFFVTDYISNYVQDPNTNWFVVLDRALTKSAPQNDLHRFYLALMNSGYVGSLYLIGRTPADFKDHGSAEELKNLMSPEAWQLIKTHPYTTRYARNENGYIFLGEEINDLEQLRSYTDLLEKTVALMTRDVKNAETSQAYREVAETWNLYQPKSRSCGKQCLGLPAGTKIFDVNVPVFSLQIAELKGQLRVVSATYSFR